MATSKNSNYKSFSVLKTLRTDLYKIPVVKAAIKKGTKLNTVGDAMARMALNNPGLFKQEYNKTLKIKHNEPIMKANDNLLAKIAENKKKLIDVSK